MNGDFLFVVLGAHLWLIHLIKIELCTFVGGLKAKCFTKETKIYIYRKKMVHNSGNMNGERIISEIREINKDLNNCLKMKKRTPRLLWRDL